MQRLLGKSKIIHLPSLLSIKYRNLFKSLVKAEFVIVEFVCFFGKHLEGYAKKFLIKGDADAWPN